MVVNIVNQLRETGLSDYEARAYMALLEEHPLTAYECAGNAGIPTSKIYGVMKKLEEKELVLELTEKNKKRYIPQEPEEYISSYRFKMEKTLKVLSKELKNPRPKKEVSYVWNLNEYSSIIERAEKMISRCRTSLLISLWAEEFSTLAPLIRGKEKEGIKTAVVHFGQASETSSQIFEHPIQDTLYEEKGGRGFTLVCDGNEALSATFSDDSSEGAWSRGRGFVTLAEDYIKHDIYIMKIVKHFDHELVENYGEGYILLRDIYSDRTLGEK
ncbi:MULTISPECIES: TrmB family transcriptional regulator [unclassified Oceanispirochaeta]|uniref:TrmB family transcriptional regulator n=1 Tax=unclassified Oceanispirochaeta TaxID=2635722 RepID=UPI000E093DC9|nr:MULTISPECIES: helix-turn-helix domain-containing protein [unclassified Oceanispirochaeta]MBF9016624.1 TrmB family transcriptional regulator [Oceanispirochaeta sp. M2]NPD73171.1 TrmB family transcriptional regulator [Oceanispirochaeta sp. M1]RDG31267.1 TrmB family transcriptional regulator [Oceanispirochaeta sp. M1]